MVRNFKGVVKVADVQAEFDNLLNTINSKIDTYNSSLTIEDVDYNNGGSDLAPYGYTLSVGGLKKVLAAYDGAVLGANALRLSNNRYAVSEGLAIKNGQVYRLPSKVVSGEDNYLYYSPRSNNYVIGDEDYDSGSSGGVPSVDSPIYLTDEGKTLVVTQEFPFQGEGADIPSTLYLPVTVSVDDLKKVSYESTVIDSTGNEFLYTFGGYDTVQPSGITWQSVTHTYDGNNYYTGSADTFVINNFLKGYHYQYSQWSRVIGGAWTLKVPLVAGNEYMFNGGWSMNIWTAQTSPSQASNYPKSKIFVHTAPTIQDGEILCESDWTDSYYNQYYYQTNESTISLNNYLSSDDVFVCPESGYVYMTMILNLNGYGYTMRDTVSISSNLFGFNYNVDTPIIPIAMAHYETPNAYLYQILVSQYGSIPDSHYTLSVSRDGIGTLKDPNGNVIPYVDPGDSNAIRICKLNKNRISKLCNTLNAVNEEIPDYKMTIESKNSGYTYNGNQYLSNSEKGQFYSGSAGRNCAIKLFDTQVAYHHWGNDRSDSYHEPLNFMFIPKGIPNPYNSLSGETVFAMQKVWNYILKRPER